MPLITESYVVKQGDTLSQIAKRFHLSLPDLLEANQQINHIDTIQVGQAINVPDPASPPPPAAFSFDGIHPAPGTTVAARERYTNPPLTNAEGNREVSTYTEVIDQFAVGHNPRHLPSSGFTFCNIFVWDVTRAMGAEIPHWIDALGNIAVPFSTGAQEITINAGVDWLKRFGDRHGWKLATIQQAQSNANEGKVAVVVWKNPIPGGHGHTAVIRPGSITTDGPLIAQAGAANFNAGRLKHGFGTRTGLQYYVHG